MEIEAPLKRARKQSEKAETWAAATQFQTRVPYVRKTTYHKPASSVSISAPVAAFESARILPSVVLSLYDKAPQLVLSEDQLTCSGYEGGYRMVRATHGVHE
eukprot:gene42974-52521_t